MLAADGVGEALREPAGGGLEQRRPARRAGAAVGLGCTAGSTVTTPGVRSARLRHALPSVLFTPRSPGVNETSTRRCPSSSSSSSLSRSPWPSISRPGSTRRRPVPRRRRATRRERSSRRRRSGTTWLARLLRGRLRPGHRNRSRADARPRRRDPRRDHRRRARVPHAVERRPRSRSTRASASGAPTTRRTGRRSCCSSSPISPAPRSRSP